MVRLGSVKAAANELAVSEAAVSMRVAQLRKEFDDNLFTRVGTGLAFTPGGLRLASLAVEILGLQDRTVREVSQAGNGRRVLRLVTSNPFAEHAAPGLINLFATRAADLEVELSVRPVEEFPALLAARAVDVAIGPAGNTPNGATLHVPDHGHDVVAVVRPKHPWVGRSITHARAARPGTSGPQVWGQPAWFPPRCVGSACPRSSSASSRARRPRWRRPRAPTASTGRGCGARDPGRRWRCLQTTRLRSLPSCCGS